MKNYLYILCAFLLAFAGCTKDADVEPIAPAPDGNTQVVLTGFSGRGTRTGFGGAEDGAVPFLWSAGDYIWARNTRSEAIAEGGSQATFVFESLETADTYDVFYNLTGPAAATALIPAEQTQQAAGELNLGQNGDFGYATAQNGTFTLEHATSYVWFDTYSSDVTSNLLSITLSVSGGQTIAGEAAFADGKLGDCKGSSSVTLSFGEEGVALPSQSNDTDVFAAMVLYPADLSTATVSIVYKFADGSVYLQTKSGKTLTPGHTLRLSTQIAKSDCKNSGAFFMTEAGVAEELPTEPIGYLKVVTLGESTLSAEELTSIAGNLANGAVIDLGEATFATTEFPMDFTRKTNLQEIALPRNIQTFTPSTYNSGAFYGCENLTRVTFPEGLTAIGQNCFRNCAKLESIELPSSVRTLDIYAFYGCKLLTSVVIPEGVEAIPRFLFDSCTALTDVTLPSTLKSIGAEAFEATGLEEITIPESVTTIIRIQELQITGTHTVSRCTDCNSGQPVQRMFGPHDNQYALQAGDCRQRRLLQLRQVAGRNLPRNAEIARRALVRRLQRLHPHYYRYPRDRQLRLLELCQRHLDRSGRKGDLDRTQRLHFGKQSANHYLPGRECALAGKLRFRQRRQQSGRCKNPLCSGCVLRCL